MEVELDLWSSRDDAVDHILSDVDCLGDVVGDVDVDEFMLACSSAEASQVAVPGDEHPASFTPEPALHHHDDLTGLHQQMQRQRQQQHGHGHGQRLHHQMVADSQHMNLNSMFDETLMGHHNHQQQQQQHQTATSTFQQQHQQQAELHFGANRLTQNDLQHHHFEQNQHHSNFGPPAPHQNDLIPLNSLVIEHQSGAPFVHQFATIQQQPEPHQQASNTSSSSSLVAARVDHCYITAESPTSEPSLQQARAEQLEPVSTSISLPDREQLQMLLDSRPQPISCPLGESPLIAVINSKSLEPLSQSKSSSAATTLKRRQQTGASVAATSPKRLTKKQQATTTLTIRLDPVQAAISSSEQQPAGRLNKSRNNNAKRAETMAKSSAGARSARGKQRAPCSGSGSKLTGHQLDAAEHQVSGQISPTLSSSSSSGISSQSSNYSDELAEGSRLDETGSSSSSSGGQLFPDSASPNAATPSNKRRRHTTPTGGKRSPAGRKPATTSSEFQESSSASQAAVQGKNERNLDDKLAISSSSPKAGKNPSQLSFEANLSAESREKLSSLSSCLISQPAGEQQQQQCNNSQPSSNQLEQAAIKAPPTASQPGRQRSSVSSSSSISSCSSMSLAACSPPNSLAGFVVSSAGPLASSTSASSSSSSASCSSFGSSSMQSPASERLASPVSSASCSPTMQLGSSNSSVGLNSSSGSSSSQLPATSSSCSFSSSLSSSSSSSSSSCSSSVYSAHQSASLISSQDWKSAASGQTVQLTEEERRTLLAAGYPIPQKFPLSKAEERSLKKIRRKIKNKISAQESRRKKKEYMEELEKRVQVMELRICELERENASLLKGSRRASSASSASSNSSSSPQSANNKSASKRSSQQRMRQSAKSSASDNNKGPSRASSTGADLAMNATMTTLSPVHQHQQQPNSLDLLRSFAVNCKQELAEAGAADATGQLVITQPREKTQTAKLGQQQQQVDSFHQLGACDNLVLIDTEQQQQQQQQQDRCAPDSAHTPQLIQPAPAAKRKDSIQSQANDDDNFIDQILLSQERQEAGEGACGAQTTADGHDVEPEVDLVANLGVDGVVVEPADIKVERHEMVVDSI